MLADFPGHIDLLSQQPAAAAVWGRLGVTTNLD
jgi:hypothetical protein